MYLVAASLNQMEIYTISLTFSPNLAFAANHRFGKFLKTIQFIVTLLTTTKSPQTLHLMKNMTRLFIFTGSQINF